MRQEFFEAFLMCALHWAFGMTLCSVGKVVAHRLWMIRLKPWHKTIYFLVVAYHFTLFALNFGKLSLLIWK